MKREIKFYRYLYAAPLTLRKWLPKFERSKNVQGYWFIRTYTLTWFIWATTYRISIHSDFEEDRSVAHERNVKRYMQ